MAKIGNFTLQCISNGTVITGQAAAAAAETAASAVNYSGVITSGLLSSMGGAFIGPMLKTHIADPILSAVVGTCSVPRCCRRYSSDVMDLETDLLEPATLKNFAVLLKSLDAALSAEIGYSKYVLTYAVGEDDLVVGYRYVRQVDGQEGIDEIILVKDHAYNNGKGLLRVNPRVRFDKIHELKEIEIGELWKREVGNDKKPYCYLSEPDERKANPKADSVSREDPRSLDSDLDDEKKEPLDPLQLSEVHHIRKEHYKKREKEQDIYFLSQFKGSASKNISENLQYWVIKALDLAFEVKALKEKELKALKQQALERQALKQQEDLKQEDLEQGRLEVSDSETLKALKEKVSQSKTQQLDTKLKIGKTGWYSCLDFGLGSGNFQLYITLNKEPK